MILVAAIAFFGLVVLAIVVVFMMSNDSGSKSTSTPLPSPPGTGPSPTGTPDGSAPPPPIAEVPPPSTIPAKPSWARMLINERVQEAHDRNRRAVADANRSGTRYDVVMYGDSITNFISTKYMGEWRTFASGWKAVPMGIGGTTIEELTWRLMAGGEKFDKDPKVVIILVGINNLKYPKNDPSERMDFFISWMRAAMPSSKIVLLGILPCSSVSVSATNRRYEALARKHGITYSNCGSDIDPNNRSLSVDGTHPAPGGYRRLFACLRPLVSRML